MPTDSGNKSVDDSSDAPSTSTGNTARTSTRTGYTTDGKFPSVAQNVARLREHEDYNMAFALQEQEFSEHYRSNRSERQAIGSDLHTSMEEQRQALENYMLEAAEIAHRDEELARNLQREMEEEYQLGLNQSKLDEEFARRLQMEDEDAQRLAMTNNGDTERSGQASAIIQAPSSVLTGVNLPPPYSDCDANSGVDSSSRVQRGSAPPTASGSDNRSGSNFTRHHYLQSRHSLDKDPQQQINTVVDDKFFISSSPPSYAECMINKSSAVKKSSKFGKTTNPSDCSHQLQTSNTSGDNTTSDEKDLTASDNAAQVSDTCNTAPADGTTVSALESNSAGVDSLLLMDTQSTITSKPTATIETSQLTK